MKKGDRVRHKTSGFYAIVQEVRTSVSPKPLMIRIIREDTPGVSMWFAAKSFEVIDNSHYVYYLVSSVVKVNMDKEKWDAGCDECFGIQQICSATDYDSLTNSDEMGVRVIGYSVIEKKEFDTRKYDLFTEAGGI